MAAKHLTVENFEDEVLNQQQPVLVDFWASWCGPCKMLSPIVEELAEELTEVKICKVNIDEQMELAEKYKVMTIPTLLVFKEGKLANTSIGVKPKSDILKMLSIV
ncbi:MAG: thioredoxin [Herbinix sp.]|jgi:thioredoxin 1|nr:thioredoxin [Herbinix sp.]